MTITTALAEAYASAPSDVVVLHTIELRHPAFVDVHGNPIAIRVVRDYQPLVATLEATAPLNPSTAVTFEAFAFDFALPELTDDNAVPEITLTIDNISREIMPQLDAATDSNSQIMVTYRPYLSTDLSAPHMNPPITLTIISIDADMMKITARATFADFANKRFPGVAYDAVTFPGLTYE